MTSGDLLPTFRDPAGSLTLESGRAVRSIHPAARDETLRFLASPLCHRLQAQGSLIAATVDDTSNTLRLLHPRLLPTYPWEWTPTQWQSAADLTLQLAREALEEGWNLKDATPLNVLFLGHRPVFVDISSFERRGDATAGWAPYGQFIRTLLLPLVSKRLLGWPLAGSLFHRDGYEPREVYTCLSWHQRLAAPAFWVVTLPVWLEGAQTEGGEEKTLPKRTQHAVQVTRNLDDLGRRVRGAWAPPRGSRWSGYEGGGGHYSAEDRASKRRWVEGVLREVQPRGVLDVGANTGEYSALAAELGCRVVALERDEDAADRLFRMSRERGYDILTVRADFARPTPAAGWDNRESSTLLSRLEGACELVMLLAIVHHLVVMEQIPLAKIMEVCARLTGGWVVVEWVPPGDPMYRALVRGREELYGGLSEEDLLAACRGLFTVVRWERLGNGRTLYLLKKVG